MDPVSDVLSLNHPVCFFPDQNHFLILLHNLLILGKIYSVTFKLIKRFNNTNLPTHSATNVSLYQWFKHSLYLRKGQIKTWGKSNWDYWDTPQSWLILLPCTMSSICNSADPESIPVICHVWVLFSSLPPSHKLFSVTTFYRSCSTIRSLFSHGKGRTFAV